MTLSPQFFLTTAGEHEGIREPHLCTLVAKARDKNRDDHLVVEITPPIDGLRLELNDDLRHLLLSAKHEGTTLSPISEWPMPVYVARIINPKLLSGGSFTGNDVSLLAWGLIFKTEREAAAWVTQQH